MIRRATKVRANFLLVIADHSNGLSPSLPARIIAYVYYDIGYSLSTFQHERANFARGLALLSTASDYISRKKRCFQSLS